MPGKVDALANLANDARSIKRFSVTAKEPTILPALRMFIVVGLDACRPAAEPATMRAIER